ncbi:MAG: chorismate mutase [Aestuariivirga sp.]
MLDAIRREIDEIDDAILDLLVRRFAATGKVKATKFMDGSLSTSPFRPAREAAMMRRLITKGGRAIQPEVLVRLWRVILSASTQSQAPVTLHVSEELGGDLACRLAISQHFCDMGVEIHDSCAKALDCLRDRRGDLAVFATQSDWADGFLAAEAGGPSLIGSLPVTGGDGMPLLLVCGHAEPQETGEDETVIVSPERPRDLAPILWQARSGSCWLTGIPGYLDSSGWPLGDILQNMPGAKLAGRYPRALKAPS